MYQSIHSRRKAPAQPSTRDIWSSPQVILGKRGELLSRELSYLLVRLHLNLKKTQESSLQENLDRASPQSYRASPQPCKNNVEVLDLILDKKRASSNVMRKKRAPSQNRRQAPPTSRSVYSSVGKKKPLLFLEVLGKRKRS